MNGSYVLQMNSIEKSFNKVPVLKKADFSLRKGEVHALMGGNGAGKSTLMKILTGVYRKDGGEIVLEGAPIDISTPLEAERHGIAMIFQEFSLIPTMTVAQNIFLKREPRSGKIVINDKECVRRTSEILSSLGVEIDPNALVATLGVGYWQIVEIAKALSKNARILIMDEPTSSLSETEIRTLFTLVRQLKAKGISIIYISHRMAEMFEICDRVTVLKDGQTAMTESCSDVTMEQIIESMLGAAANKAFVWKERHYELPDKPVLEVRNLSQGSRVKNVNFSVYPGEIVGLAGLMGSGRTEIAETIFGIRGKSRGEVLVNGKKLRTTRDAIEAGVALVPEDRRKQGLILEHSVRDNMMLPKIFQLTRGLVVNDADGDKLVEHYIGKLRIKTDHPHKIVKLLSGGNQQKIVLAKWLARNPTVLLLDEPTIGVDIGAKSEIVEIIRTLADSGIAVLVISSELEELLAVSDRILILYDGEIIQQMQRREIKSEEVLHHAIQGF